MGPQIGHLAPVIKVRVEKQASVNALRRFELHPETKHLGIHGLPRLPEVEPLEHVGEAPRTPHRRQPPSYRQQHREFEVRIRSLKYSSSPAGRLIAHRILAAGLFNLFTCLVRPSPA